MLMNTPSLEERLRWFMQAKFGMFIHWGVYAVQRNGEWSMNCDEISNADYRLLAEEFTAEHFDADAWVQSAKDAGMRYMVLTTKHHDGFCLWDTRTTDFNATQIGPRRDIVREFVDACRRHGIRVGLYWSWVDWHYPEWGAAFHWTPLALWRKPLPDPAQHAAMVDFLHAQVRELMTNYGEIDVLWFDGGFLTAEEYRSAEMVAMVRALQPRILINDRSGLPGDFANPEGLLPRTASDRAWELCHCSHSSWGMEAEDPCLYYPPQELLALLCDSAALGGNLLLNVGPRADGTFPEMVHEQLAMIGEWMRLHGAAIYGCEPGPFGRQSWGVSTRNGQTVYLLIFRPTAPLLVRGLRTPVCSATAVASGEAVAFSQKDGTLRLELPAAVQLPQGVALTFEDAIEVEPTFLAQEGDGSLVLTANAATIGSDAPPAQLSYAPNALGGKLFGWKRIEDYAEWEFVVETPGVFQVFIEYNNVIENYQWERHLEIRVGAQRLHATAPRNGRLFAFASYRLAGRLTLEAGEHTLTVKPSLLDSGPLLTLRAVRLVRQENK